MRLSDSFGIIQRKKPEVSYEADPFIGPVSYDDGGDVFIGRDYGHAKSYSENTAAEVDSEIKNIIMKQYAETEKIIKENRDVLERVAEALLEKETITGEEFEACFNEKGEN